MSLILFFVILSVLVIVHELGHFFVARFFGVRVDEFGIGYPPKAKKLFRWKGTDFTLNWLPFGGFVKIFGEEYDESGVGVASPESLQSKHRGIQAAVLVAGVLCNFIFAALLIAFVVWLGLAAPLSAVREGGISLPAALVEGFRASGVITVDIITSLGTLARETFAGHPDLSAVAGPVGLVSLVGEVGKMGWGYILTLVALISLNLSVINLLPLPALDGGRLLFVAIEASTRKRIPARVFNILNAGGFAFLLLLMVLITIHDVRSFV